MEDSSESGTEGSTKAGTVPLPQPYVEQKAKQLLSPAAEMLSYVAFPATASLYSVCNDLMLT